MTIRMLSAAALMAATFAVTPAFAQDTKPGCDSAAPTTSATPPAQGPNSGTAPGGMGSSGWSGGTGGSNIGTGPQGPTAASPTAQPQTAQGLDPTKPGSAPPAKC